MDEKNSILRSTDCPSVDELSLFLDVPSDDLIAEHVSACEKCQAILAAYDQIGRIQQEYSAAPDDLIERIQGLCRQQSVRAKPAIRYPGAAFWLRMAAGLAVLASAAGVLTYVAGHRQNSAGTTLASHSTSQAMRNEPLSKIEQVLPGEVFSLTDQMRLQGNNIETDALQSVSTSPKINAASGGRRKYRVGDHVEHIWVIDNLQAGKQLLHKLASEANCPLTWQKDTSPESLKATISGTDKSIQSLVNNLKDRDWILLSPTCPQPHAENSTLLTGNQIQYQATIVKKE